MKKFKQILISLLLTISIIIPINVLAYSEYIYAGGENIGIQINSKGVLIVGSYEVNGENPMTDADLKLGDKIISINNTKVNNIDDMVSLINKYGEDGKIALEFLRNDKEYKTNLKVTKDQCGVFKTGLYVKDNITGIGTLTFIDPESKLYGALGHEIIEQNSGILLDVKDGKIFSSEVTSIDKSENGEPGEKNAKYNSNDVKGNVSENTNKGIFGKYTSEILNKKLYKVAQTSEIKMGNAKILTVLDGTNIEEFNINITKLNKNSDIKNILFEITDSNLLKKTNGVVAGMSGSPIIQNDKIIGAITHVVVDSPTSGYGIFITNMLEEAEN